MDEQAAGLQWAQLNQHNKPFPEEKDAYRHVEAAGWIPRPARPWFPGAEFRKAALWRKARSAQQNRLLETEQRHCRNNTLCACAHTEWAELSLEYNLKNKTEKTLNLTLYLRYLCLFYKWNFIYNICSVCVSIIIDYLLVAVF